MSEELRQAKEKIKWEVDFAISQVEKTAQRNNFEVAWMLEEFRNQVVTRVNNILKG